MNKYFQYCDGAGIVKPGDFRISASQVSRFFDQTSQWFNEFLEGQSGFQGSTASELGNCVHAAAAMYIDNGAVDYRAIEEYIDNIKDPDIDKDVIRAQYEIMINTLIDGYLDGNKGTDSELFIWKEILPGIGAGGSIDKYDRNRAKITDFKTMGSLDKARLPSKFPRAYWFQQMTYAWVLTQNGYPVDYIELVYVTRHNTGRVNDKGKALKDYPSQVHIVRETVTAETLEIIGNCLKLVAESVDTYKKQPELRHLLSQDMRLKVKPAPTIFKD